MMLRDETATKICRKCGEEKPLSEFYRYKTRGTQMFSRCKPCSISEKQEIKMRKAERNRAREDIIYPETKWCYKCKQVKSSSEFHKSTARDDGLRADCKKCRRTIKEILWSYKRSAKKRYYEWTLSDEEATNLFLSNCFYCGAEPKNGIDRVDSRLGYTISNCVSCCSDCNYLKRRMPLGKFKEYVSRFHLHIERIYLHYVKGGDFLS